MFQLLPGGGGDDVEDGGASKKGGVQMLPANSSPYHWHEIRMKVDLPRDPFYCGSMTILVSDERGILWSSDIAVGTVRFLFSFSFFFSFLLVLSFFIQIRAFWLIFVMFLFIWTI